MIWLIGNKGMLGSEMAKQLTENRMPFVGTDREIDITNPEQLEAFASNIETTAYFPSEYPLSARQVKWIVNCAAYTNVDKAEEEPDLARKLNVEGPCNIARVARKIGSKLIHISTDYVFNGEGKTPYLEDDPKDPTGVYGQTKSLGEDLVRKEMTQHIIIRTSWLYGFDGKNFVYTMTKLMNSEKEIRVVNDQRGTPTCAVDLAAAICEIINRTDNAKGIFGPKSAPGFGIYQYTNSGETTWYDFAKEIYKIGQKAGLIKNECNIRPCTTEEYNSPAKRPAYSVLSKEKIVKSLKLKIPAWQSSLEKFMKNKRFQIK